MDQLPWSGEVTVRCEKNIKVRLSSVRLFGGQQYVSYIEDLTYVVISYEIHEMRLRRVS